MSNGDDIVREQQANYPDEPFKPWAGPRFRLDPTGKDDFERGNRMIREVATMAPVCLAYGKDAAEAILALLNAAGSSRTGRQAMSLRENVARRLSEIWDMSAVGLDFEHAPEGWLSLADETIRQMRWARHSAKWANPETMPWVSGEPADYLNQEEVSIAPDQWPGREGE